MTDKRFWEGKGMGEVTTTIEKGLLGVVRQNIIHTMNQNSHIKTRKVREVKITLLLQ